MEWYRVATKAVAVAVDVAIADAVAAVVVVVVAAAVVDSPCRFYRENIWQGEN